jgi:integrase
MARASIRKRTWRSSSGEQRTAWQADYSDQAGKRHRQSFGTKREADAWLVTARHEVGQGTHTPRSDSVTVAEAGETWLAQGQVDGLEASTLMQYRQHLDLHILPLIGTTRLAALTPATVVDFRRRLLMEGRSPAMTKRAVASLGAILANAQVLGRVGRNVVRDNVALRRRLTRLDKRHEERLIVGKDIPTKEELRILLEHATGAVRALIVTVIFTGLRASELRGLCWEDIDLVGATLVVRQRADRWNRLGSPKSAAGRREIPLAPLVVNTLREWRLACPPGPLGLVFPNTKGNVQSLPNLHRRGLGELQVKAGIAENAMHPKYGLHAFRHAAASLFIEQGWSPKRVQAVMGHSSIQVTFDTYGHLFPAPQDDREAMRLLQARLLSG